MAFLRTINVEGKEVINEVGTNLNFSYTTETAPSSVNFSIYQENTPALYGSCNNEGITTYSVTGGIITAEYLTALETRCKEILLNYETV